ncbi:MAG: secretin N-terminal domain-containing protein [Planctomycetota bacterium]
MSLLKAHATNRPLKKWKQFLFASLMGAGLAGVCQAQQSNVDLPYPALPGQANPTAPGTPRLATEALPTAALSNDAVPAQRNPVATAAKDDVTVQVYNVPSDLVGAIGAQLQVYYRNNKRVSVTTEPKTGQLMVMAPPPVQHEINDSLTKLMQASKIESGDKGQSVASTRQRTYKLQNLTWREVENAIQSLAGSRATVSTDPSGETTSIQVANQSGHQDIMQVDRKQNQVTFVGSGASVAGWGQVVFSLDQGQADVNNSTHVVPLSPAEPRRVKAAIQLVRATTIQEGGPTEARVDIGDDETATAMGTLDNLDSGSGLFGDVQIEFVEEIDLVIIRGSKRDVQRTLEVIEKIKDQAKETQPEVEVYKLQNANAEAVATLVTELYANIFEPRQGAVSITALGQPNSLLLIGRKEVIESVKALVEKIDTPLEDDDQLKVIRLEHASSVDVEQRVREFFTQNPPDGEQRINLGTRVKVLADYRTNSLIVQASPREMVEVEKLIEELDVEGTTAENEVRVFKLRNTLSDDLQNVIQEVITGEGAGGDSAQAQPPSGRLKIVGEDGPVESGILAGVVVTSDPTVNALVVRAPSKSMELIRQLISQLDELPDAEALMKVFPVKNGDATTMAQLLQQLFGLQVTAGTSQTGGLFGIGNLNQNSAGLSSGDSSLVPLRISADTRTNAVIVSGSESDLDVIQLLILRLDEEGVENRRTDVIWLRNARAEDIANALNSFLQTQRQAVQQQLLTGGYISIYEQVDREVFVVAESATNSLILSATPRYYDTIMEVITRLDRRPPMVHIDCMIAEVQLDDGFEFGTEWGIQDGLLFDRQLSTAGTLASPVFNLGPVQTTAGGQSGNVAGQALSNFALGRTNSDLIGGLVLSASSEAVGVLIRALRTAGRLQVLSAPKITTMESVEASTVLVGQLVPRIQGVTNSAQGIGQTITTSDTEVGLGLAVTPRVNQDGLVNMSIQVFNSALGPEDQGIPVGFSDTGEVIRSPIIDITEAATWISAYSGQTVVFAGLISKQRQSISRRIPVLGSLPLVGPAFRYDQESEQRRELLVVMTPRIIQTDEDYDMLAQIESSRMSWCLADVQNVFGGGQKMSGGNGLWGPARSAVIYPDIQPAVIQDRSTPRGNQPYLNNQPVFMDGVPVGAADSYERSEAIAPAQEPTLDTARFQGAATTPAQPVGFRTQVPSTGTTTDR